MKVFRNTDIFDFSRSYLFCFAYVCIVFLIELGIFFDPIDDKDPIFPLKISSFLLVRLAALSSIDIVECWF